MAVVSVASGGEEGWRHHVWAGHTVCAVQEREQDHAADAVQPLPQDQCQTGRRQQHSSTQHTVCSIKQNACLFLLLYLLLLFFFFTTCNFMFTMVKNLRVGNSQKRAENILICPGRFCGSTSISFSVPVTHSSRIAQVWHRLVWGAKGLVAIFGKDTVPFIAQV